MYQEREALEYRSENDNYEKVKLFLMKNVWRFLKKYHSVRKLIWDILNLRKKVKGKISLMVWFGFVSYKWEVTSK
jgi:hypothetical protein